MNLLEIYITKVHSETPIAKEDLPKDVGGDWVKVVYNTECYGRVRLKDTGIYRTETWEKIKSQGYYMG